MSGIVALSGWGQPGDALHCIAPNALHVDYAADASVEAVFARLDALKADVKTVIGWSLGGQLAVRAIAAGVIAPKNLVLIAAPFRFVRGEGSALGMGRDTFGQFRANLIRDARRTLQKSYQLILHDDTREDTVRGYMGKPDPSLFSQWQAWLDRLGEYSCEGLDFARFSPTLLLHGQNDAVVSPAQSRAFVHALPRSEHVILPGCGHAPHWHDAALVTKKIAEFCS